MGKYVKKGKITGDVTVVEVPQAALGVRTRAKTLALQQNPELSYLQLRSRRLEKPQLPPTSPKINRTAASGGSRLRGDPAKSGPAQSESNKGRTGDGGGGIGTEVDDFGIETSFGENKLEFDQTGRGTRESTPCSLIRDLNSVGTPGSAVRSTCSGAAYRRQSRNSEQRANPFTHEMEDFFASAEMHQQKYFTEKYNYDVVNDLPLCGRYEWVRIDP